MWVGTNVSGHKHAWAQTCLITNMPGHKHAWTQSCLGTNVYRHNRARALHVWTQSCGHKHGWAKSCGLPLGVARYGKLMSMSHILSLRFFCASCADVTRWRYLLTLKSQ